MDTRLSYDIANDIFDACAKADKPRNYLGMSEVGHPCDRFIWFKFRQFTKIPMDNRMFLLFRFGDKIEELICSNLRAAGYKLENAWPDPQAAFVTLGGILHGHSDGAIYLPEGKALLECKSANKKKFQAFTLGGVRATYEKYYWQSQLYMGCGNLDRALFVILCKDDSNIYTEIVPFNKAEFNGLIERIRGICTYPAFPPIMDIPDCQYCDYRLHCKTNEAFQTTHNCMTCNYLKVTINESAEFYCQHPAHAFQIHHTDMNCQDYSWVGTCPF